MLRWNGVWQMARVRIKKLTIWLILLALGLALLWVCRVVLVPLLLAALLAYLLLPPVKLLERWLPGWLAIVVVYTLVGLLVAAGFWWGMPRLLRDFSALSALVPRTLAGGQALLQACSVGLPRLLGLSSASTVWEDFLVRFAAGIGESLYGWVERSMCLLPSLFSSLSMLVFAPVFAFYLLRDREIFRRAIQRLLPEDWALSIWPLFTELNAILHGFVRGYVLVALCVGVLFYLLLWLCGVDYAFTLGLIMAVAELIPYIGPFIAFIPCLLLVLVQGRIAVIKMLVIWLVVQQLENIVISPHIMSDAVRLHPLYVILAVLVGGFWFGVPGMILAVPLAASLAPVARWVYGWWMNCQSSENWL